MVWAAPPGAGRRRCETQNEKPEQRTCFLNAATPPRGGEEGNFLAALTGRPDEWRCRGHDSKGSQYAPIPPRQDLGVLGSWREG